MMNFLRSIWQSINDAIAAPGRFIKAANTLSSSVQEQTRSVEAFRSDVLKAIRGLSADGAVHHQELVKQVRYLAQSEHKRNQREGKHFELVP
jgi:hypothetical protein